MNENNTALVAQSATALTSDWTAEDLAALKETLAKDLTDAEFKVYIAAARKLGLDPFARQVYGLKQNNRMTIQVSIDGFRLIADRTGKYAGQIGPLWCGDDGEWCEVWLKPGKPAAAKVGVLRRDFDQPIWGVARMVSYYKDSSPTWKNLPDVMIAKVAESLALRRAFPAELSGVYEPSEMDQAERESVVEANPQPRHTTTATAAAARPYNPLQDVTLRRRLNNLGIRSVADVQAFIDRAMEMYGGDADERDACDKYAAMLEDPESVPYELEAVETGPRPN